MKYILLFGFLSLGLLASVAGFVYAVDPLCYYRCEQIDLRQSTQNVYYQGAQIAKAHGDAEVLILGSSRGQTTSPLWFQEVTGQKTLNLSLGGADLLLKLVLARISEDSGAPIKKIIWMADYFEFIPQNTDAKVLNTKAFAPYLPESQHGSGNILSFLQRLIDHKSFEASIANLKKRDFNISDQGAGSGIDYKACLAEDFKGSTAADVLGKEVDLLFESYKSSIFKYPQSESYWDYFVRQLGQWSEEGVEVEIVIAPYHPQFMKRMQNEIPEIYKAQADWISRLESLNIPKVKVKNFINGIPGGDASPRYWDDGVHYSCRGAMHMI